MSFVQRVSKFFRRKPEGQDEMTVVQQQEATAQQMSAEDAWPSVQDTDVLDDAPVEQSEIHLPLLGPAPAATHQRRLLTMLALGVILLALVAGWVLQQADRSAKQLAATGQSLMQSQRLAKSVTQALLGKEPAFSELQDSASVLGRNVHALTRGMLNWVCKAWMQPMKKIWARSAGWPSRQRKTPVRCSISKRL